MGVNVYDYIHYPSKEELKKQSLISKNQALLGIYFGFDSNSIGNDIGTPSNYRSLMEYEYDKDIANNYIIECKEVPEDLRNRLLIARKELEDRGILKPFNERAYI